MYSLKEKIALFLLCVASLLGVVYFFSKQSEAFPSYHINFVVDRKEAANKAEQFAKSIGLSSADYKHITVFQVNDADNAYFQKELGVEKTAALEAKGADLWHFSTRFFKPLSKEEFTVNYSPNGQLRGFSHLIEDDRPGDRLTSQQAQAKAEQFLTSNTLFRPEKLTLVEVQRQEKPQRNDFTIVWRDYDPAFGRGSNDIEVVVRGSEVSGFQSYTTVGESWVNNYLKEQNKSDTVQLAAEVAETVIFSIAIIAMLIYYARRNRLKLKYPLIIGAVTAIVVFISSINMLPSTLYSYDTAVPWSTYIATLIFDTLGTSLVQGLLMVPIFMVGSALSEEVFPQQPSLQNILDKGPTLKPVNKALLIGFFAAFLLAAYQIVYYILGRKIGFWSPATVDYEDLYSTLMPWSYPLFIGFTAATFEEGMFRYVGLPYLKKYLKNGILALILTSVCWAFLHSSYAQYPWYVRGVEISIIGLVFGGMYYRFGLVATFAAHFVLDAFLTGMPLFSSNLYSSGTVLLVVFLPLIIALAGALIAKRMGGFQSIETSVTDEVSTTNPVATSKPEMAESTMPLRWLTQTQAVTLIVCGLWGLGTAGYLYPKTRLATSLPALTVKQAIGIARKAVTDNDATSQSLSGKTSAVYDQATNFDEISSYVLAHGSLPQLKNLYSQIPPEFWTIRFAAMPDQTDTLAVLPNGQIYSHFPYRVDTTNFSGPLHRSQQVAERYLVSRGINLGQYKLVEYKDAEDGAVSKLVYEDPTFVIDKAPLQLSVSVKGDSVVDFKQELKLPPTSTYGSLSDLASVVIYIILSVGLLVLAVKAVIRLFKNNMFNFKEGFIVGGAVTVVTLLNLLNSHLNIYQGYDGSLTVGQYLFSAIAYAGLDVLWNFVITSLAVTAFLALWRENISPTLWPKSVADRVHYCRQGLLLSFTGPFILMGAWELIAYAQFKLGMLRSMPQSPGLSVFDTYVPAFSVVNLIVHNVLPLVGVGIVLLLAYRWLKKWSLVAVAGLVFYLILYVAQPDLSAVTLTKAAINLFFWILVAGLAWRYYRDNLLGYLGSLWVAIVSVYTVFFLASGSLFYRLNGVVLVLLLILPLIGLLGVRRKFVSRSS